MTWTRNGTTYTLDIDNTTRATIQPRRNEFLLVLNLRGSTVYIFNPSVETLQREAERRLAAEQTTVTEAP